MASRKLALTIPKVATPLQELMYETHELNKKVNKLLMENGTTKAIEYGQLSAFCGMLTGGLIGIVIAKREGIID